MPDAKRSAAAGRGRHATGGETRTVRSAVCPRCGCACDDVDLVVSDGRVVEAGNACPVGRAWFLKPLSEEGPPSLIEDRAADPDQAVAAAASLLAEARRPLVWGLLHLSCEAQRVTVEIAERLGAVIDPAAGPNHPAAVAAFQEWGEVNATLGEPANQSGLAVLWFAEPERTHPRLLERWRIDSRDAERLIRVRPGEPADDAWTLPPERKVEFLWLLRELALRGDGSVSSRPEDADPSARALVAGHLEPLARRLLGRLARAPHVVFAFEAAETDPTQQHALRAVAATLNAVTRFRLFPLRGGGNRIGAEAVLTWQTGFPVAVDFSTGTPRYNGYESSAARLLERDAVDAALVVCASPADAPAELAFTRLSKIPLVLVDPLPDENPLAARARVVLRSARSGLASGGTLFRMDGVALGLRPALTSRYPSEEEWLRRLLARLSSLPRRPSETS